MYQITSLIEKDPNSKILVFSEYDSSFTQIKDNLKSNKISYDIVHGSSAHITNLIRRMKDGEINVLLLNSRAFGAGLNLEMASDIILYHKMKPSLQTQVIGRAHRFGRVGSLKIHHLLTEEEM
jgi:SNF2 family DNA or RNA helicase